jgi:hypothetical protein
LLEHKWEGVQTVAARVLGEWGGAESVAALREWLSRLQGRPYAWAARGVAAKTLAMCVTENDIRWVLDLYFALPTPDLQYELLPTVTALPADRTVRSLRAAVNQPDRREAAIRALTRISAEAEFRARTSQA